MELTIRINDRKSYEALLHFLQSLPAEVVVKEKEKEQWNEFSTQNLARAYAEDEPEYSTILVKESNPLYEGR
jgi:hypothetical protein